LSWKNAKTRKEVSTEPTQYNGVFKSEGILPIQPGEKNNKMALFDLQTAGFWVLENARSIAVSMKKGVYL
jgi:hypothetical protein